MRIIRNFIAGVSLAGVLAGCSSTQKESIGPVYPTTKRVDNGASYTDSSGLVHLPFSSQVFEVDLDGDKVLEEVYSTFDGEIRVLGDSNAKSKLERLSPSQRRGLSEQLPHYKAEGFDGTRRDGLDNSPTGYKTKGFDGTPR